MSRDAAADRQKLLAIHETAARHASAQAASMAQAALDEGLQHPLLYSVIALHCEESGRLADAEAMLRRGLSIVPHDTGLRNALGLCLMSRERPAQALEVFRSLLLENAGVPYLHANKGSALLALGAFRAAEESYQRAVELDPRHPVALAGLASLCATRGAYPPARAFAQRALNALPGYPDALLSLAAAELGEGQVAQAEERLRGLLGAPGISADQRAAAKQILGEALDGQGRFVEAIGAYEALNEELRTAYAGRFEGARPYVESLTRYFNANAERWGSRVAQAPRSLSASPHIFVLGFPRSGSTLLKLTLEGHPDAVCIQERELLIGPVRQLMQRPEDLDRLLLATPAMLDAYRDAYLQRAAEVLAEEGAGAPAGKLVVDVEPLNTLKLLLIAVLFPGAKILFACRDPRDVVFSCFRNRFRASPTAFELLSLEGAALYYDAVMRFMVAVTESLPLDICLVRHEDLVTGYAREMKRICEFLEIQWVPTMGDFAKSADGGVLKTAELTRRFGSEGIGHWRHYQSYMQPVLPVLEPWISRFYYPQN